MIVVIYSFYVFELLIYYLLRDTPFCIFLGVQYFCDFTFDIFHQSVDSFSISIITERFWPSFNFHSSWSMLRIRSLTYCTIISLNIFIYSGMGNKFFCNLYESLSTLWLRVLPCSGISLLFFKIYKGVFNVQEIWLSHNTGQPFIVPFRRTIIVSWRPYSQMVSRESRKFSPWNFHPETGIEPGTFVLVVRCTKHYTTALIIRSWILAVV